MGKYCDVRVPVDSEKDIRLTTNICAVMQGRRAEMIRALQPRPTRVSQEQFVKWKGITVIIYSWEEIDFILGFKYVRKDRTPQLKGKHHLVLYKGN